MKSLLNSLKTRLPKKLPTGMTELNEWLSLILSLAEIKDTPKNRMIVSNFIFSLPPNKAYVSPKVVSNMLIKAASNQVFAEVYREAEKELKDGRSDKA